MVSSIRKILFILYVQVFDEGVDAVKAKISAETGETEAANDDFEAKVKQEMELEKESGAAQ